MKGLSFTRLDRPTLRTSVSHSSSWRRSDSSSTKKWNVSRREPSGSAPIVTRGSSRSSSPSPIYHKPKRTLWITTILFVNESQRSPAFELLMVGIRDVVRHEYMFEDGIEFGFSSKSKETELGDKAD